MNDKLDIYFSKVFCRMRHKTQLFNGTADDHYHTRLQHTIEVEEIALRIAKRIMADNPKTKCDLSKVSAIALLHDIGHTPFGHAGEKALHEMVSGKCSKEYGLPDFKELGISIGFKHNINSGLLYIENRGFDKVDVDILDGIVKHTRLTHDENDGLDYGFEYIFHDISKTNLDYYNNQLPKTIEAFIDAFYHKATLRIHDVFVDENNWLMEIINISNTMKEEALGYEYKYVNVEPYVNKAGIVYLSMKQSTVDNSKIILQSGGDITITGSNLQISNQTVLSIIHNLELESAWLATKSDLYTIYDYEKYLDVVHAVDDFMSKKDVKKSKFEKFIKKAKGIAGVLGTFVAAILVEIMNNQ